ncbi:MAG TPA: hypothetical protein VIH45_02390 [Desulfuromonadaceae bacterium]
MSRLRKENPRYNVISMRISEEERRHLEAILIRSRTNVSHFMRDAMRHFTALYEQGEQKRQAA